MKNIMSDLLSDPLRPLAKTKSLFCNPATWTTLNETRVAGTLLSCSRSSDTCQANIRWASFSTFLNRHHFLSLFLPGEPEDRVQGELQVRGAGEVASEPGGHHAAASRGILEVNSTISPWEACPCKRNFLTLKNFKSDFAEFDSAIAFSFNFCLPKKAFIFFPLIFAEYDFW